MDRNEDPFALGGPLAGGATGTGGGLEGRLLSALLSACGHPPVEFVLWNGVRQCGDPGRPPVARVRVHTRGALLRMVADAERFTGDDYAAGRVDVDGDMVAGLEHLLRGLRDSARGSLKDALLRRLDRPRANSLGGSRRNIRHHYDLGNDFYRLWLDQAAMQYTCAYYASPAMSLEQAQIAKLDHVARKLRLSPGETVFEAGCGWGGLARHFAARHGVRVRAFNISAEQVDYAREAVARQGLADRVEVVLDDYRHMHGRCDAFVSVGMLEHVGLEHYGTLGRVIDRVLAPHGRALIHSIGRNRPAPMNAWIEKRIFPGAYPPTLAEMMRILDAGDFSVLDVENLRLHYAATLRHWLERFEAHTDAVRARYGEAFVRTWRLYLAGSTASFLTGTLQLFQVLFARGENNTVPMTRAHLYLGPGAPEATA